MNFRTELIVPKARRTLGIGESVLTLGSCFAQSIGQRFLDYKFQAVVNPLGTTYHPMAIHRLLDYAIHKELPKPSSYLVRPEVVLNYEMHSSLSAKTTADLEQRIRMQMDQVHQHLKACRWVMLTYGTAWVYERKETGEAVANCHKMPPSLFNRRLVSVEEITDSFQHVHKAMSDFNPEVQFILTVSPVRHVKDTLALNSVSKSALRLACHRISETIPNVDYFPAYEILMDDLRDYRYYQDDLIHPTVMAEDYIWEKFSAAYFGEDTKSFIRQWHSIRQALNHRPFHEGSDAHQQFIHKAIQQLEKLRSFVPVDDELRALQEQLVDQTKSS